MDQTFYNAEELGLPDDGQILFVDGNARFAGDIDTHASIIVLGDLACQNLNVLDLTVTGTIFASGEIRATTVNAGNITCQNLLCCDITARDITVAGDMAVWTILAKNITTRRLSATSILASGRISAQSIRASGDIIAHEIAVSGDIMYRGVACAYDAFSCRSALPATDGGRHFSLWKQVTETGVK